MPPEDAAIGQGGLLFIKKVPPVEMRARPFVQLAPLRVVTERLPKPTITPKPLPSGVGLGDRVFAAVAPVPTPTIERPAVYVPPSRATTLFIGAGANPLASIADRELSRPEHSPKPVSYVQLMTMPRMETGDFVAGLKKLTAYKLKPEGRPQAQPVRGTNFLRTGAQLEKEGVGLGKIYIQKIQPVHNIIVPTSDVAPAAVTPYKKIEGSPPKRTFDNHVPVSFRNVGLGSKLTNRGYQFTAPDKPGIKSGYTITTLEAVR